jgi:acid phosphatase type 7
MTTGLRLLSFLGLLCPPLTAFAQSITRGPYLQNVTPTSIIVRWRTDVPTDSRVRFGADLSQQAIDSQSTTEHTVLVTGLQPATRYGYAVGTSQRDLGTPDASFYFQTAPAPTSVAPVRLWVLGDFGTGSERQKQAYDSFAQASQSRRPDLWVWLGDNAYSSGFDNEFQGYVFDYYPTYLRNVPFAATPGNHDYGENVNNFNIPYYTIINPPTRGEAGGIPSGKPMYYSMDYGPVHLISLDSFGNENGQSRIWDTTGTQIQWLKRDLAANKKPWTVVFFHHPPYTQGSRNSETEQDLILNRERLTPIFERYNVDLVLCGHSHVYERSYPMRGHRGFQNTFDKRTMATDTSLGSYNGLPNSCPIVQRNGSVMYIVNGAGGANTGRAPGYPHKAMRYSYTDEGGSMLIDVSENRLDGLWVCPSGIKDRFTLVKNVNHRRTYAVEFGDTLTLTASWAGASVTGNGEPASYAWSNGQTSRSLRTVNQSGTFRVQDKYGCLADEYTVQVAPRPRLLASVVTPTPVYCAGSSLTISTAVESTTRSTGPLDVQLSNASGSFTNPLLLGTLLMARTLTVTLPNTLDAGTGYQIRAVARNLPIAEVVNSAPFGIQQPASAAVGVTVSTLTGQPAAVTVTLAGTPPWQGAFSNGTSFSAVSSPAVVGFQTNQPGPISLSAISNGCGSGTVTTGTALVVLLPTGNQPIINSLVRVYPNPTAGEVWLEAARPLPDQLVTIAVVANDGAEVYRQSFEGLSLQQRITIPLRLPGQYVLSIQAGTQRFTYKLLRL